MKHTFTRFIYFCILFIAVCCLQACFSDDKKGLNGSTLEFSNYLAIGDEYTAGYMNGGLYEQGQLNSFPNIVVKQLNQIGSVSFAQPLFDGNGSGYMAIDSVITPICDLLNPKAKLRQNEASLDWQKPYAGEERFRNMGLPKLKVASIHHKSLNRENPFFSTLIQPQDSGNVSYSDALLGAQMDFFTLWVGMNDVLAYAVSGGDALGSPLTHPDTFETNFSSALDHIVENNPDAKGIIANVMDVTQLPFFCTIPHEFLGEKPCGSFVQPIYITTHNGVRVASERDKILLIADSLLGKDGWGLTPQKAIPNSYVLDEAEVMEIKEHILAYNEKISLEIVSKNEQQPASNLGLLDLWYEFDQIHREGRVINGLNLNGDYLSGGLYSLDGLFPTPRGNAFIGNLFINSMNVYFGYNIPNIDITEYKGVEFP